MSECNVRSPNASRLIKDMDKKTLMLYASMHISLDSQDLIDALRALVISQDDKTNGQ